MDDGGPHELLMDLLALPTAPLNEGHVAAYVRAWASRRPPIACNQDRFGNLVLTLHRGDSSGPPLVLCAHMDHPGFEATRMVGPGRLEATWRGGVRPDYFPQARVRFFSNGRWIRGEIERYEVGNVRGRERVTSVEIAVKKDIEPGAIGMWDLPNPTVRSGRLHARGCDDVAGVAAILEAMDALLQGNEPVHVTALFTRGEEIGFAGAIAACRAGTIPHDGKIVAVETSSEIPGVRMGDGPILRVGDQSAVFSPGLTAWCRLVGRDLAKEDPAFKFQRKLMDGGTCESTVYGAHGYDATGLCIALGNYHNMNRRRKRIAAECIHLADYRGLMRWFVALATTRRPYDAHHQDVDTMLGGLEKELLPELERTADRVRPA